MVFSMFEMSPEVALVKIRILLAVSPPMFGEALRQSLALEPDLEVVDEVFDPIDLMLAVRETEAHVVVITVPFSDETPGVCTHLLSEFPDLTVIGVCPEVHSAVTYRNSIEIEPLAAFSLPDMLSAIRGAPSEF